MCTFLSVAPIYRAETNLLLSRYSFFLGLYTALGRPSKKKKSEIKPRKIFIRTLGKQYSYLLKASIKQTDGREFSRYLSPLEHDLLTLSGLSLKQKKNMKTKQYQNKVRVTTNQDRNKTHIGNRIPALKFISTTSVKENTKTISCSVSRHILSVLLSISSSFGAKDQNGTYISR